LKQEKKAKEMIKKGIIITALIFGGLVLLPEKILEKIPTIIIPLGYTVGIYKYAHMHQAKKIEKLKGRGGQMEMSPLVFLQNSPFLLYYMKPRFFRKITNNRIGLKNKIFIKKYSQHRNY